MGQIGVVVSGAIVFTLLAACSVRSQTTSNFWPGVAPASEAWKQQERKVENTPVGTVIFNVVTPTITAFVPEKEGPPVQESSSLRAERSSRWPSIWRHTN